jgi:hypothetical protein
MQFHLTEMLVTTSIELADVVAGALCQDPKWVRLHLKMIRATGNISFKGYGRGAAKMGPLDAARLVIALAGSLTARHAGDVLADFQGLKALGPKGRGLTLEAFLEAHIEHLSMMRGYPERRDGPFRPLYRLAAEEALKVIWCETNPRDAVPKVAIVRWFREDGGSDAAAFSSAPLTYPLVNEARLASLYPKAGLLRTGSISARAMLDIAMAL